MNRFVNIVISLFVLFNFVKATNRNYQLIWEDQFEGSELNSTYWNIEKGGGSNWNNTAIDDPRVIEVSNGTLKLKAIKNPNSSVDLSTVQDIDKTNVWTGAVDTHRKVDFKYGKVEVRARLEAVPRAWPAIWLMPTESVYGGNPDSGEIDIVERLNLDPFYYSTIHTEYHTTNKSDPERYTTESAATIDQWTVFSIEWDENKIEFFRDGNKYHSFNRGMSSIVSGLLRWPFDQDFYIILSQQIGGGWVDGEAKSQGLVLKNSDLPYEMEIDYVRVYELDPVGINDNNKISSLKDLSSGKNLSVYYTGSGNIKLSRDCKWGLYDLSGQMIKSGKGDSISFAKKSSGCYLIKTEYGTVKLAL